MVHIFRYLSTAWDAIAGKPSTFPPDTHEHDASHITSGTLDVARIPVLPSQQQVVSGGAIDDLTWDQELDIASGTLVTTTDGRRWVYSGTGSKTNEASYIELADVTPAWTSVSGKPVEYPPQSHAHDAADITSGVLDVARIPVLPSQNQIVSSGGIANVTTGQQSNIVQGTLVTTTDGRRWVYKGSGSKTSEASYIELADITPEWTAVSNKPATFTPATHTHAQSDITGLVTGLSAKAPLASPTFTGTVGGITKAMVGLSNVDNTSDANKPVSTATQTALDLKEPLARSENAQTGSSYTLVLSDAAKLVTMDQAATNDLIVPAHASVAFPAGTRIPLGQMGTGRTQIVPASGVTILSRNQWRSLSHQLGRAELVKRAANEWWLSGDLKFSGALDDHTDALVSAWSPVQRLLTSYTGPLLRVREDGADAEMDVGAMESGLVDVQALTAFAGVNSIFAKTLLNQVDGVGDFSQSSSSNQPLVSTGTGEMTFDNTDDYLQAANEAAFQMGSGVSFTVMVRCKPDLTGMGLGVADALIAKGGTHGGDEWLLTVRGTGLNAGGLGIYTHDGLSGVESSPYTLTQNNWQTCWGWLDESTSEHGQALDSDAGATRIYTGYASAGSEPLRMGMQTNFGSPSAHFNGQISHVAIWKRNLSVTERSAIHASLR